jgi:hypothetical protein
VFITSTPDFLTLNRHSVIQELVREEAAAAAAAAVAAEMECEGNEGGGQMPEHEPRRRAASRVSCRTTMLAIAAATVVLVVGGMLVFGSKRVERVATPAVPSRDGKAISSAADSRSFQSVKITLGRPVQGSSVLGRDRASKAARVGRES